MYFASLRKGDLVFLPPFCPEVLYFFLRSPQNYGEPQVLCAHEDSSHFYFRSHFLTALPYPVPLVFRCFLSLENATLPLTFAMRGGYEYGKNPDQSAPKTTIATHNSNISLWLHQTVEYSAPDDVENPLDLEISHDSPRANFVGDSFPHVLTASVRGNPKCNISHLHFHVSFSRHLPSGKLDTFRSWRDGSKLYVCERQE